jgi:predicted 3-demethylubiquinone-9 3-methyltransferase (glyoxalase superfamily)
MQKITPFLWFEGDAGEAMKFYASIFPNSKVVEVSRTDNMPGPSGSMVTGTMNLNGQDVMVISTGAAPGFKLNDAFSMHVHCDTQAEVDEYWGKLIAGGGEPGPCGWLKDKFGLSWQIVPAALYRLMSDPDTAKSQRVMQAMLQMSKLDIAGLQRAYDGA